jgi:hypothetical protein
MIINKRGQNWYIDFSISIVIFVIALIMVLNFLPNTNKEKFENVMIESEMISDMLMSEGVPVDWDDTDVLIPGILTDNKLDIEKLGNLYSMEYITAAEKFNAVNKFYIYFQNCTETCNVVDLVSGNTYFGNIYDENSTDKSHKLRILPYGGDIIVMNVVVWS